MSEIDQKALPDVREWSGDPPGCPGVVGRPFRMSGSGRETLADVPEFWEALLDVRQLSGGLLYVRVVGMPSRMSESGREALPNVQEWSGGPPGCLAVIVRPSRMSGSGREALPYVR